MPVETRIIEFSEIEVINALSTYQSKITNRQGRKANISNLRITGGHDFHIVAKVPCQEAGLSNKVFDYNACLACFLLYAKMEKIPLPKKAEKAFSPSKFGGVVLSIKFARQIDGKKAA